MRDDHSIGSTIRRLRGKSITQQELADRAGVSVGLIRNLEQGRRHTASLPSLHRIAAALGTDLPDLLGRPRPAPNGTTPPALIAIRNALTSVDDLLGDLDDAGVPDLAEVQRSATYCWGAFSGGRYDLLGEILPRFLAETRAVLHSAPAGGTAEAADLAAQAAQIATGTLMQFGALDLAHATARDAIRAATAGQDPLREVALRHSLAHVLMRQGRQADAQRLMIAAVRSVRAGGSLAPTDHAVTGALLLRAAGSASRAGAKGTALDLIGEAEDTIDHLNGANPRYPKDYAMAFGRAQIVVLRTDVNIVAQNYDQALKVARTMPRTAALPLMSRLRHLADQAHAHAQLGQDDRATDALLTLQSMAPHLAPFQTLGRLVARDLLSRQPRPQLRELAKRWNATS